MEEQDWNNSEQDAIDAAWDQLQQEERQRLEEEMLSADPGYFTFLQSSLQEP